MANRNLREYSRKTRMRMVAGFLVVVFVIGDGLIFLFYGARAGLMGLACLVGAMVPVGLVVLILKLMETAARKGREG